MRKRSEGKGKLNSLKGSILIDAREYEPGRLTGIGRVLTGLADALAQSGFISGVALAARSLEAVPAELRHQEKIRIKIVQGSFLRSEQKISDLTGHNPSLFISPYPKLPLFGCHCPSIHIVHDVLDLTHPAYQKRLKTVFDQWRLKRALKSAALTWYDSFWSLNETRKLTGFAGRNPCVRYPGIEAKFDLEKDGTDGRVLKSYALYPKNYILVIGNGLPHKNVEVLLSIKERLDKTFVFVGMFAENIAYWRTKYPKAQARYLEHVPDEAMPAVIRGAFCLAQPSTAEGYGYPPLEAMACGVPAVVSNIPVLEETTGQAALTADPQQAESWLEALRQLEDNQVYQKQVEKGLRQAEPLRGRKGWQAYVEDVHLLLTEAL